MISEEWQAKLQAEFGDDYELEDDCEGNELSDGDTLPDFFNDPLIARARNWMSDTRELAHAMNEHWAADQCTPSRGQRLTANCVPCEQDIEQPAEQPIPWTWPVPKEVQL